MRSIAFTTFAALSLLVQPIVAAGIEDDPIYQIGDKACTQVLDDEGFQFYGDAVGGDPSTFCACIGTEFVANEPLQSFRMDMAGGEKETAAVFADILKENFDACLPPSSVTFSGAEDDEFIDGDLVGVEGFEANFIDGYQDGPNWAEMPDRAHCEFAIDGLLEPTEFARDDIQKWIADSGVGADDLCSCAAAFMEDAADEYATEFEATGDGDLYWSYMNRSIDQCQTAIWKRPI